MSDAFTIQFTEAERQKLATLTNDLAADAGVAIGDALRVTGGYIAKNAGFATKKAKKTLPIRANTKNIARYPRSAFPFYVIRNGQGLPPAGRNIFVFAQTRAEVRALPFVQIKRRGLAKSVWGVGARTLGQSAAVDQPGASRYSSVTDRSKAKIDKSVTIESKVNYAADAFKQKGTRTVASISGKAVRFLGEGIQKGTAQKWAARLADQTADAAAAAAGIN